MRSPNLLVSGCYWSLKEKIDIQFKSNGKIKVDNFFISKQENIPTNNELRNKVFFSNKKADNFDKFFFETLKYCFPKSMLENLDFRINETETYLDNFKNIKFIMNENLTEDNLALLSIANSRNIKTIYSEHNTLNHPFVQDWTTFISSLFDYYFTLGWKNNNKKFFAGGSLYPWIKIKKNNLGTKNKKILFIPSIPIKRTLFNSSIYGEDSFNNMNYFNLNKLFFSKIDKKVAKKIIYKKYPNIFNFKLSEHENKISKLLRKYRIKVIDEKKRLNENDYIKSELIIVNYLKTSLIQTLKSNIPTVIFFNNKSYFLKKKYEDFFKELFKASIVHKNALSAAKFVNKIMKILISGGI